MELFEQIHREYEFGVGTIAGVSRKLGVHRRMVREALNSAVPAEVKPQQRRLWKLEAATAFIDRILVEDRQAQAKQRHTAHRIWHSCRRSYQVSAEANVRYAVTFTADGSS